jgi:hypothetical protein
MIDLTHQKPNLLLVCIPFGNIVGNANKKASPVRLGSQGRGSKAPKALAAVFGTDYPFKRVRFALCRHVLTDILKHFARAFAKSASRPIFDAAQLLSRIAGLFEPTFADPKNLLLIVENSEWQWRVEE